LSSLVSVIVPCYNARQWIARTLQSIFQQSDVFMELIVVNDGSTDDSLLILEKLRAAHLQIPFQIITTKNRGVAEALETGRLLAKGDFFQYVDSDDVLFDKHKIARQVQVLLETKADIAFCDYEEWYPDGRRKTSKYAKTLSERPAIDFLRRFWRPTAAFLFSRSIVEKIGSWNVQIKIFNEVSYYLQAASLSSIFVHTPNLLVLYHISDTSLSRKEGIIAYFSDYYTLLTYFCEYWVSKNVLDNALRDELIEGFRDCAKAFVLKEKEKFEACIHQIYLLNPNYIPKKSRKARILSYLLGYKKAEYIAGYFRRWFY
jgi:glycosyltransferase involved in cell wall biosynthesis